MTEMQCSYNNYYTKLAHTKLRPVINGSFSCQIRGHVHVIIHITSHCVLIKVVSMVTTLNTWRGGIDGSPQGVSVDNYRTKEFIIFCAPTACSYGGRRWPMEWISWQLQINRTSKSLISIWIYLRDRRQPSSRVHSESGDGLLTVAILLVFALSCSCDSVYSRLHSR